MRRLTVIATMLAGLAAVPARAELVTVNTFSDLLFWTGSGTNSSALVLQFGTAATPTSVAWGYRWNGSATMADMLFSLAGTIQGSGAPSPAAGADARLAIDVTNFGVGFGWGVNEVSYDQRGLPAGWSNVVQTISTDPTWNPYPAQYRLPSAQGVWTGDSFTDNPLGISNLTLANGGWYGVVGVDGSYADGPPPTTISFSQPVAAVPEPSSIVLLAGGAVVAAAARWRFRRRGSLTRAGAPPTRAPRS